jgi:hypothetical protein
MKTVKFLVVILSVILALISINETRKELKFEKQQANANFERVKDSLNERHFVNLNFELKKQQQEYEKKLAKLDKKKQISKQNYSNAVTYYYSDSLSWSEPCDSVINTANELIGDCEEQVNLLCSEKEVLLKRIVVNDSISQINRRMYFNCELNEQALQNSLKRYDTLWYRNKFKIGFGTGVVVSVAGVVGLVVLAR